MNLLFKYSRDTWFDGCADKIQFTKINLIQNDDLYNILWFITSGNNKQIFIVYSSDFTSNGLKQIPLKVGVVPAQTSAIIAISLCR